MKKNLLNNFIYIVIGLVFAVGLSYIHAASFSVPTVPPPGSNTALPLNVGTVDQVKPIGACTTGNCGGLALMGGFLANQDAAFSAQSIINGLMLGGTPSTDGTLAFGNATTPTPIKISGAMNTTQAMQGNTLKNTSGNNGLCANAAGQIVLCNIDICSNIAGTQLAVPSGDVANKDGTCSPAPKRFWAVMPYEHSNGDGTSDGGIFMGGAVIDSNLVYHTQNGNDGSQPYVDGVGLYNGKKNSSDWIYDQIPGVNQTDFTNPAAVLMNVVEAGSYHIKISSSGTIGIKGKYDGDSNTIGVDFYLQINDQYIPLDTSKYYPPEVNTGKTSPYAVMHELYPVPNDKTVDFGTVYLDGTTWGGSGNGNEWANGPYSFAFDKTYNLKPGDIVRVHAYVYGHSRRDGFLGVGDGYNNFFYNITSNLTVFDITETPQ